MSQQLRGQNKESGFFLQPDEWVVGEVSQRKYDLRHSLLIILKRKWMILATLTTLLGAGALYSYTRVPLYRSTAVIEFDAEAALTLIESGLQRQISDTLDEPYLRTRYNRLKSRDLAIRVVRRLNLDQEPVFVESALSTQPGQGSSFLGLFTAGRSGVSVENDGKEKNALSSPEQESSSLQSKNEIALADHLRRNLSITPVTGTRLVDISYTSPTAPLAAQIVNTLAEEAIKVNLETHVDATRRATEFLETQLLEMQGQVEASQEKLLNYARTFNLLDIDKGENLVLQKLESLSSELSQVETHLISESFRYERLNNTAAGDVPSFLEDDGLPGLEERKLRLSQELSSLEQQFGPRWKKVAQLKSEIAEVENQLDTARKKALERARLDYQDLLERRRNLSEALSTQLEIAERLKKDSIQYNILKDEVESTQRIHETLLQRVKEAGVIAGLKSNNVHIVDHGVVADRPFVPDHSRNLAIALGLGLFLGVGISFVIESVDNTVKTPDDVETELNLPCLGFIPTTASIVQARENRSLTNGSSASEALATFNPYTQANPRMWEAFRSLRTSLMLSTSAKEPRSILITSAFSGEGKTTIAFHMGIVLAQTGARTLILDTDLRRPSLGPMFDCESGSPGLSDYLAGNSSLAPLIRPTQHQKLFVVPSGSRPPNPAELLGSEMMRKALCLLAEHFTYIVVDSPPLLTVTDALVLSPQVDGVVVVAKAFKTAKEAVQKSGSHLASVGAKILGVALNEVNLEKSEYYYYYGQYYDYRSDYSEAYRGGDFSGAQAHLE